MTFCLFSLKRGFERAFFHFQEIWEQIWEKNSEVCSFLMRKSFTKFLAVSCSLCRIDWESLLSIGLAFFVCRTDSTVHGEQICWWNSSHGTALLSASSLRLRCEFYLSGTSSGCEFWWHSHHKGMHWPRQRAVHWIWRRNWAEFPWWTLSDGRFHRRRLWAGRRNGDGGDNRMMHMINRFIFTLISTSWVWVVYGIQNRYLQFLWSCNHMRCIVLSYIGLSDLSVSFLPPVNESLPFHYTGFCAKLNATLILLFHSFVQR